MPAAPKPVDQRHGHRRSQPKRAPRAIVSPDAPRPSVPQVPAWLPRPLRREYAAAWAAPVASLWGPETAELVAELVSLRDRIRRLGDEAKASLLAERRALETALLLTPRAQRATGVTVADPEAGKLTPAARKGGLDADLAHSLSTHRRRGDERLDRERADAA